MAGSESNYFVIFFLPKIFQLPKVESNDLLFFTQKHDKCTLFIAKMIHAGMKRIVQV